MVDDARGVVLDVSVTEGTVNEREVLESQVEAVRELSGRDPALVTADSGYAYSKVYAALERRGVAALIPAKKEPTQSRVPLRVPWSAGASPSARKGRALLSFEDA